MKKNHVDVVDLPVTADIESQHVVDIKILSNTSHPIVTKTALPFSSSEEKLVNDNKMNSLIDISDYCTNDEHN